MKMKLNTIIITTAICIIAYLIIPSVFVYAAREDMSITYLQMLPDESIRALSDWCAAHTGEPVSSNTIIDVPNYVSCNEVLLDSISREADKFKQQVKDYCNGDSTFTPEQEQTLKDLGLKC